MVRVFETYLWVAATYRYVRGVRSSFALKATRKIVKIE